MSKARGLADLGNAYSDGALSNRNLIINGAMQVAQRGTSFSTSAPQYTLDRMRRAESSLDNAVIDVEQSTDAPDGFAYSLKATTSTVEGTVNAGDAYYPLLYRIEAQDLQRLQYATTNAKTLTASFWVKSSVTGTYVLSLYNNDNARLIGKAYSINTANTWEYKVLTFAGDTTDGFNNDTGIGLELYFAAGGGSQFTSGTLPSAWEDYSNANFLAGQSVNLQNTLNATWQITGVQLEVGDTATPFEHRSYSDELQRCMRYYYNRPNSGVTDYSHPLTTNATTYRSLTLALPQTMRAAPTVTYTVAGNVTPSPSAPNSSVDRVYFQWNGIAISNFVGINVFTADAEL